MANKFFPNFQKVYDTLPKDLQTKYEEYSQYTSEQWGFANSVKDQTNEYLNQHPELNVREGTDAAAPIIADNMRIPTVAIKDMQRFNEDVAKYEQAFADNFGVKPVREQYQMGAPHMGDEIKPFGGIPTTQYETEWLKEKDPSYVPPENKYLDKNKNHDKSDPGYYSLENGRNGMSMVFGTGIVNNEPTDMMFPQRYGVHVLTDPEIHSLLLGEKITIPTSTDKVDVKLEKHEGGFPDSYDVKPIAPEKTPLKAGEYEVVQDKKGTPYIHGKPDFEGAPADAYFKQTYGNHELTDSETKALLKGDEISVPVRSGEAKVKLGEGEVHGHSYFGLQRTDIPERTRRLPDAPETSAPTSDKQVGDN